jgi:dihydrolipoamide dehydrogenase
MTEQPASIIILGGGAIGCEFAHILASFGTAVTLVEMLPRLLPGADGEAVAVLERSFKRRGIKVLKDTRAVAADLSGDGVTLKVSAKGAEQELKADKLLVVTGRIPNTEDLGLERAGLSTEKGFIPVGPGYRTASPRIRAAGDIVAGPMLAHLASKEAEIAVEGAAGQGDEGPIPWDLVPAAVYTEPQIAGFGWTEERAKEEGRPYKVAVFPFKGVGKAAALGRTEGLVKIITDPDTGEILGGHGAGSQVTEIIHELLLAKNSELLTSDLAGMIHAHPSLSEAVMEAAKAAEGGAIHI